jgi:predicted porin
MQKKLLTVAVAGALAAPGLAVAQSTTEVYGLIQMAFGQFRYSEGAAAQTPDVGAVPVGQAAVSKMDVQQGGSNFGVRAREDVGAGLAVWIQAESNLAMERSNNPTAILASRNSAAGLQGGFGNIFLGQWTTPWADLDALWGIGTAGPYGPVTTIIGRQHTTGSAPNYNCVNQGGGSGASFTASTPVCDALEGGGGVGHAFWRRTSSSVFYQSPVMAGVQVKLAYQTNDTKSAGQASTNADPSMWSTSVQWAGMGGRARVGVALDRHKDFTSIGGTDTGYAVKGGWNFGVIDIGFAYETMKYKCLGNQPGAAATNIPGVPGGCESEGDIKAKQYAVALAVPVGPGSIRASYAVAKDLEGPITTAGNTGVAGTHMSNTGAKQYNIGYEHRFSKRSNVSVGYAKVDNKANATFHWLGATPPNQTGASTTPLFGSDPSIFFVSILHRF